MPICSHCGKEVSEGIKFCPECGERLTEFTPEERREYIEELRGTVEKEKGTRKENGLSKGKIVGIVVACIVCIILVIAVATPSPTPTEELPVAPPEEPPVTPPEEPPVTFGPIVITGTSDKTSPPFAVTTEEWIIDWSYIPDPEYPEWAAFGFSIYPRGETVMYVETVYLSFSESTSGSTYSYAGSGEYYIQVICANINSWEIIIRPA